MPRCCRFIFNQYRLSCRAGFGSRKAARRAVISWIRGF
jgi:hypothetical protein